MDWNTYKNKYVEIIRRNNIQKNSKEYTISNKKTMKIKYNKLGSPTE